MKITKWDKHYAYAYFCDDLNALMSSEGADLHRALERDAASNPADALREFAQGAQKAIQARRKKKEVTTKTTDRLFPETCQVLFATQPLMDNVFKDEHNRSLALSMPVESYQQYFSFFDEPPADITGILKQLSCLEKRLDKLPLGQKLTKASYAQVVSKFFALVASFVALATYDESTHLRAGLFLDQGSSGDADVKILEKMKKGKVQFLCAQCNEVDSPVTENEPNFDAYVVTPLSSAPAKFFERAKATRSALDEKRLKHALLRHLCARIVKICAQNGRMAPNDAEASTRHPALATSVKKTGKTSKFVPLVFSFIIELINAGHVEVAFSHVVAKPSNDDADYMSKKHKLTEMPEKERITARAQHLWRASSAGLKKLPAPKEGEMLVKSLKLSRDGSGLLP